MPDGTVPVLLSADTPELLRAEAASLLSYLRDHRAVSPGRVADMLFRTRLPRRFRALVMVTDRDGLTGALESAAEGRTDAAVVRSDGAAAAHRLAYVLPGQGGQRPGMGARFYESLPAFRAEVDRCDGVFGDLFGESPLGYLLGADGADDNTTVVQSALFMQMAALGAMWRSFGIEADAVVGHSQGEIAAAYLAGKMTLDDAVLVLGTRARAVETISSDRYAMAVIAADRDECESVLARQHGWAQVSVVNAPRLVGISGERDTVEATVDVLEARGRFTRLIPVSYPAHTSMVNDFRDAIGEACGRAAHPQFVHSAIDCIGSTLGEPVTGDIAPADYWFWNLRNTVRFDRAVAAAVASGTDTFVELAEHPTLQLAVEENLDALAAQSTTVVGTSNRTATDLAEFTHNLAVLAVNDIDYPWDVLRTEPVGRTQLPLLDFPNTLMNEQALWLPYAGFVAPPTATPESAVETTPTPSPQVLVESWVPLRQLSLQAPQRLGIVDHTGRCADLSAALCAHADSEGIAARPITDGVGDDIDTVVILVPEHDNLSQGDAADAVVEFFTDRRWWFAPSATLTDYWLVTVGGEKVLPDDGAPQSAPAAISAGFRCLRGEFPDVAFRHLDLQHGNSNPAGMIRAMHIADEPELALRTDHLYAKRLTDAGSTFTACPVADRHVLITGGTGALGLQFCEHAAREGAQRITLVSRSGETPAVAERLARIRRPGTDIQVIACDVAGAADVDRLAHSLGDREVDIVIHAVMDRASATEIDLADLSAPILNAALRGKAVGISRLLDTVPLADGSHVLLCSSTASVLGGRGKIAYSVANRMLDAYAQRKRAEGSNCVAVQWGQWDVYQDDDRADTANLAGIGYLPMRSQEAITLGLSDLPGTAAVVAFDWERTRTVFDDLGYGPTLSQLAPTATTETTTQVPRAGSVRPRMLQLLAEVIGADDPQALDGSAPLVAVGLDSLNALQLRRLIKVEFDSEIAVSKLLSGSTLDDVAQMVDGGGAPAELDFSRIASAREDLDRFGLGAMWRLIEPVLGDGDRHTADEIADRLHFVERHRWILRQWLYEMVARDILGNDENGYRQLATPPPPMRADLVAVCEDLGYLPPFGRFLAAANENLAGLVADEVSMQELLFPNGSTDTAAAFYRENAISRYLNRGASTAVADAVRRLAADRSPVRILELGAGVGGMTDDIVGELGGLPVDYRFTDVSTFFLNEAQKRFADHPWIHFEIVDLNTDLGSQPPSDIVVAANVVHNAHDVGRTLGEIHRLLRPGGTVLFIEVCKAHCSFMTSVYFLMSPRPGQPQVGLTDVRAGTDRIFLTQDEWHSELRRNGFRPAPALPGTDDPLSLLDQYLFAAVRS